MGDIEEAIAQPVTVNVANPVDEITVTNIAATGPRPGSLLYGTCEKPEHAQICADGGYGK